jgi:uncharacterized pyridoxal phosphate-containing UPF0001 family protein
VAVTKTFPHSVLDPLRALGLFDVGENYTQELLDKVSKDEGTPDLRWHFLGQLQSNKIGKLCRCASVLETVSRKSELEVIARQERQPEIYVQIDFTGQENRGGAPLGELEALLRRAELLEVTVSGLMTVAAPDPQRAREAFSELRRAASTWNLPELSMGMSDDLEIALEEGSTAIRVGRALLGSRPQA